MNPCKKFGITQSVHIRMSSFYAGTKYKYPGTCLSLITYGFTHQENQPF